MALTSFFNQLVITKRYTPDEMLVTKLNRSLSFFDLMMMGVGSTLGVGVYVVAGVVAHDLAGPAGVLSFGIAALCSIMAGLCFAEFAVRVPRAGSVYVYTYATVGEFVGFVSGWSLIMEYVIGASSVMRASVEYIDALPYIDHAITTWMRDTMPIDSPVLSKYPDIVSFTVIMLFALLLASGIKTSTMFNNVFAGINLSNITLVIVAGLFFVDGKNWSVDPADIPDTIRNATDEANGGTGGFMPYGVAGVMAAAAKCFYAFIGFDTVATMGEEAKNAPRNVPIAIVTSLLTVASVYFLISSVLTLAWPYYDLGTHDPLPHVFRMVGQPIIAWIVSLGAIGALLSSLFGTMVPLPRIVYAMSNDGLLFAFLGRVHSRFKTPMIATLSAGVVAGVLAMIFDLDTLIDMMSIGTLGAYAIVALCVMVLRYEHPDMFAADYPGQLEADKFKEGRLRVWDHVFNVSRRKYPSIASSRIAKTTSIIYALLTTVFCFLLANFQDLLSEGSPAIIVPLVILFFLHLLTLIVLQMQPAATEHLSFKVFLVPWLPAINVTINTYLMMQLDWITWIRFLVWIFLGLMIYFFYGMAHSVEARKLKREIQEPEVAAALPPVQA